MPLFPYKIENPSRQHLSENSIKDMEYWVNYGLGEQAFDQLDEAWYLLLAGSYTQAARLASRELLADFGWILAELAENWPANAFGSEEKVKSWRGLVEDDPTLAES